MRNMKVDDTNLNLSMKQSKVNNFLRVCLGRQGQMKGLIKASVNFNSSTHAQNKKGFSKLYKDWWKFQM